MQRFQRPVHLRARFDAFGEAVLQGVETALKANGAAPVETASYARQSNDSASAIAQVNAVKPDAVVVVGPSNTVAPVLKSAHAKDGRHYLSPYSFVGTDELIQEAGADREGAVITQVVPAYFLTGLKTVPLDRRSLSKYMPSSKPNFVSLEGVR